MEYRQLGRSGLKVSTITLGTMGFGGTGWASPVGHLGVEEARQQIDLCLEAGVNLIDTADIYSNGLSEEILGEALGADRDEVLLATKVRGAMGDGPERRRAVPAPHHARGRGQSASARHRLHRPLPGARVGRAHAAGGDAVRARRAGAVGQGPLHRLLELHRPAADEGAVDLRPARLGVLRQPADLLLAAGPRRRERADPDRHRGRARDPGLESAGRRSALRQVPARAGRARRHPAVPGLDRAAGQRRGPALRHRRRAGRDRRRPRGLGRPGRARVHPGQAGGDLGDRRRPDRGAAARQPRCRRADPVGGRRSTASTRSARCRCSTRTGTRPTPSPPASARPTSASSTGTWPDA